MPRREVFPNAPLAMVVAETRFSYVPELDQPSAMSAVLSTLSAQLPVLNRSQQTNFEITVGSDGSVQPRTTPTIDVLEARATDSQTTAAVTAQSLTLAMSGKAYTKFEDSLRPLLEKVIGGLQSAFPATFVTRAGLRYLDEIRVPDPPESLGDWSRWIASPLLGAVDLLTEFDGRVAEMRSTYRYDLTGSRQVVLNWGPFLGTGVVGPDHPFHLSDARPERMFVLDLDASWTPSSSLEPLDPQAVLTVYDELHGPAQSVFQSALTDDARNLFRSHS